MKPTPGFQPSDARLPRLRSVEAAKLLEHQMYFWGKDVLHPAGNLLVALGCSSFRRDDAPHHVRCYALTAPQGRVVLHSTGVLLQPDEGQCGIAYLRPAHRLYHVPPQAMPLPCASAKVIHPGLRSVKSTEFPATLTRLLQFVRELAIGLQLAVKEEEFELASVLRHRNPHHSGGMFRRPFLYRAV